MNRPTPKEFAIKLLGFMFPSILLYVIFLFLVTCSTTEQMYRVSGPELYTVYHNKKGELIEVPWKDEDCKGYKKPYHITQYNNVGTH